MKIADFYDDTVTVTVEHRGRTFEVEAYPERSTGELGREADRVARAEGLARGEWHVISTVVASWTLEDEFTEGSVLRMSQGLRMAIIGAVGREAAFPTTAESEKTSESISSPAATTEDSPAGTDSPTG